MAEEKTETKTCQKLENVTVDAHVEADLSGMLWRPAHRYKDMLEYANDLQKAIKEFEDFLRDHRSQDMVRLDIVTVEKDICSNCHEPWETDTDENGEYCMSCGATVEFVEDENETL